MFPRSTQPALNAASLRRSTAVAVLGLAAAGPLSPIRGQAADSAQAVALARSPDGALPLDGKARTGSLPNGVRYYVRANGRPEKRAELRLVVHVGSVQEDDDQRGLAHVLEHMAFNGTRRFAKQEIVSFIERAGMTFGADLNAGTSFDETVYMLQMPSDTGNYIGRAMDWFADIAGSGISLDSLELEKERPVVVEEWRLGQGSSERIQQQQFPVLFHNSLYAQRLPIGTRESLSAFTRAQLGRFYREWYRPELMAVVAVGDFNADSVEAMIRAQFAAIPVSPVGARPRTSPAVPGHAETLVAVTTDMEASESNIGVLWKRDPQPVRTVRDYQRDLARGLFLSMLNQRFDEIVRKPDAPFAFAGSSQGRLVSTSEAFSLDATVRDGGIERGLAALMTEAERVRRHGFTQTELDRQKTATLRSIDVQYNERDRTNSAVFASRYVNHFLTDEPQLGIEFRAPLVRALLPGIALAQVNQFSHEWMTPANRVILASAPVRADIQIPASDALIGVLDRARNEAVAAYTDATASGPLVATRPARGRIISERRIDAIGVTEWTLSNGARVFIKPTTFKRDEILFSGVSLGGVGSLPPGEFFSAQLGPALLERGGAGTLDAIELRKQMADKMASVSASVDPRGESINGSAAPKDLGILFELVWAKVRTPRVDSSAISAYKSQLTSLFQNRSNQPGAVYFDTIGVTMSQGHPLSRPVTTGLIDSLDVQVGLRVFNDRFRDFSDFTFVVIGSVELDSLRPHVEQWLAALPGGGRVETPHPIDIQPPAGSVSKVVRKGLEPKAQTNIYITGSHPWSRDDAMRSAVITEVLQMRLRDVLREDLGGTYGPGFGTSIDRVSNRFQTVVNFGAAPDRVDSLATVALDVVRTFASDGPTADELAKVRENLLRTRERGLSENGFWLGLLQSSSLWNDDPVESVASYTARVAAIDAASVQALARVLLNEANLARFTLLPERPAQ